MFELRSPRKEEMASVYGLRWEVLRDATKDSDGTERDRYDTDPATIHSALFRSGELVATARLHRPEDRPNEAQVRFMATRQDQRRLGLGSAVLWHLEIEAATLPVPPDALFAQARMSALGFWEGAGYMAMSDVFELPHLPGIPHIEVVRPLL